MKWNKEYQELVNWFYNKGGSIFFCKFLSDKLIYELTPSELDSLFYTYWFNDVKNKEVE